MKLKLLLSILAFAALIGGASVAYNHFSKENDGSNLQVLAPSPSTSPSPAAQGSSTGGTTENETVQVPSQESTPTEPSPEKTPEENPDLPAASITPSVPDFTVYDINGAAVKLSDYFGKPIVLNFFASWCGPCRSEMPAFQTEYEVHGEEIAFVFVSVDSTMADAKQFVDGQGYTFPILHDASGSASAAYTVRSIPATYFIDRNGTLVAQAVGALRQSDLKTGIDLIK